MRDERIIIYIMGDTFQIEFLFKQFECKHEYHHSVSGG